MGELRIFINRKHILEKFIVFFNFKKKISNKIGKKLEKNELSLVVLDDVFPHPLSAFRMEEYTSYLKYFKKIKIFSDGTAFPALKEQCSLEEIIKNYEEKYPQFKKSVEKFHPDKKISSKLAYMVFKSNMYKFLDIIEKFNIPFVFTLYPGGFFELNNKECDSQLKKIFKSPLFRKVIVTQKITYNYLIEKNLCKSEDIVDIFGVVTPLKILKAHNHKKKHFGIDKNTLDICFVGLRYSEKGIDKGYDIFIEVAHNLYKKYDNINFHVVGEFDEQILDVSEIKDRITFHQPQLSSWFNKFYEDKDIILSPNIPFKLLTGDFDGFPTGCSTDAGLHEVAVFCTDELNLNDKFIDGEELVIIPHDSQKISKIIESYYNHPEKLKSIGKAGCLKMKDVYSYENQIKPRIELLEKLIK